MRGKRNKWFMRNSCRPRKANSPFNLVFVTRDQASRSCFRMACMVGVLECRLQRLIDPLVDLESLAVIQPYVIQGCNKFENWRFSDPNNNVNNQSVFQGFSSSKSLGADYHYSPGVRHLQLC
jgi:hypothetical protein